MTDNARPYHLSRLRRALVYFVTGRLAQAAARAILILVLVRLLSLPDYGAYMLLVGLAEMQLQVASFGILPVGRRYLPQMLTSLPAGKLYCFVTTLIGAQLLVLSVIVLALWSAWVVVTPWFGFSAHQAYVAKPAVLLFMLVPAFRFCSELLEALLEQAKSQTARAFMPTGRVLGIGALVALGLDVNLHTIIMVDVIVTATCLVLAWTFLQASLRKLHAADGRGDIPVREMLRFAWHMAAVDLMGATAAPGAIRLALANTLGVVGSGLFAFLQSLEHLVLRYLPSVLLSGLVRPMLISRAFQTGGMAVLRDGSSLLFKTNLLIVALGTIVVAVAGDTLVAWASGGKFTGAGLTLMLIFLALAFKAQRSVIEMIMQITGHTSILRATALVSPLSLLAVWLFADQGINVAVSIIVVGSVISNSIAAQVLSRVVDGYVIDWRGLGAIYVLAALAVLTGALAAEAVPPLAAAGLAVAVYAGSILIVRPFRVEEMHLVEQVLGRRIARFARVLCNGRLSGRLTDPTRSI